MTEFTGAELNRLIQLLPITDPTSEEYSRLLYNVEKLACCVETIDTVLEELMPAPDNIVAITSAATPDEEGAAEDTRPGAGEAEEEASAEVVELPSVTYTLAQVRAALIVAKKQGVDIKALINGCGAANLSDLPAEKYAELMKRLEG